MQLELHGRGRAGERLLNNFAEHVAPRCPVPLQKGRAREFGQHTNPWKSLGEGVRQSRRPQVAKHDLEQISDGQVEVLLGRLEVAKVLHSDVLRKEQLLVWDELQSHPSSLEKTLRDTRVHAARVWRDGPFSLAALHRDNAERAVKGI